MEPIGIALVCAFTLCIFLFAVRSVCLRVTRSKMLEVRCRLRCMRRFAARTTQSILCAVFERVKWLDLYGMCRIVCLNPTNDPEIDAIIRRLVQKYPFAEIGAFQTRKNVL